MSIELLALAHHALKQHYLCIEVTPISRHDSCQHAIQSPASYLAGGRESGPGSGSLVRVLVAPSSRQD